MNDFLMPCFCKYEKNHFFEKNMQLFTGLISLIIKSCNFYQFIWNDNLKMNHSSSQQTKHLMNRNEEKILIKKYASAADLKNEIRQKMASHRDSDCESLNLSNDGSVISLTFKSKNK